MTVASAPSTHTSAASSAQLGRSLKKTTPLKTPSTGMTSMLMENTLTGTEVAILIQAQWAKAKETSTLYATPAQADKPTSRSLARSSNSSVPAKIGTPPSSMIHAV